MSNERGSLRTSLAGAFKPRVSDQEAERLLLDGRTITEPEPDPAAVQEALEPPPAAPAAKLSTPERATTLQTPSLQPVSNLWTSESRLRPKSPLNQEPNKMVSFRCPMAMADELSRKAKYSNLSLQDVLAEGLRLVLAQLPEPPAGSRAYGRELPI
jgi:hypothetical protein